MMMMMLLLLLQFTLSMLGAGVAPGTFALN
jgi:hypothetical protein